ncbi:MAG: hypothetical protein J2P29_13590, partial [Actinobacteria bacterium]|nr:hypothetical protein [Actinomycetota bacterium]
LQADLLQAGPPPVELAPAPVPVRVLDTRQAAASPVPPDEPLAPKTDPASVPATAALRVVPPAEPAAANGKSSGKHTPAARRPDTEPLFADMARLAGIPPESYAVGKEVDGAMCLVESDRGFEVFHFSDGARTEIQVFATEEAACFYLFGVLAAEGVGTGTLAPVPGVKSRTA